MPDQNIKAKQAPIQQLRPVAEKVTAWLEKNRLLYTEKRPRLDSLIELRFANGGEVTPEEQKLSKYVALYESRRSGMWEIAFGVNREEKNLEALKRRRKKKKEEVSEKDIIKIANNLVTKSNQKSQKQTNKCQSRSEQKIM